MSHRSVILFIFFAQALFGQSSIKLDGYVHDAAGDPLADVSLEIVGGNGVYSDSRGYFYFENLFAGSYQLSVAKIGYEKQTINFVIGKSNRANLQLILREKILTGPSIRVEGKSLSPASAIQLGPEQINRSPAANLGELLQQLPAVRIVSDASGAQRISVRGSALNQVLVLLDGVALNDPFTGMADLARIPTGNIARIRLLKGNQSARYGSGAIGGVLLISTLTATEKKIRLAILAGSFGQVNLRADAGHELGAFSFKLGAERAASTGDFRYTYQLADGAQQTARRINGAFQQLNLHGDIGYHKRANRLLLFVRWQDSNRGLPGQVFGLTPYASAHNRQRIIGASHTWAARSWFNRVNLQYSENNTHYKNDPPDDAPLTYRSAPAYDSRYKISTLNLTEQATISFWNRQTAVARFEFRQDDFNDRNNLVGFQSGGVAKTRNRNAAFVLQNEWYLPKPGFLEDLQIEHALRLDYFKIAASGQDIEHVQFRPEITLSARLLKQAPTRFWLRYGRGFRMPTFADLFYQDFRVKGNADLLPEISHSLEGGLESNFTLWGKLKLSVGYFDNKIDNLILWQLGSFSTWQPFNTNARISGWELSLNGRFWHDHLILTGDTNILNPLNKSGERTTNGRDLTYRPRRSSKLGIGFHFSGALLNGQYRYEGKRYITASNTVGLPPYAVQDVTFSYKWILSKNREIVFQAAVYNLSDHHFEITEHAPMPGRNGRIGVEAQF